MGKEGGRMGCVSLVIFAFSDMGISSCSSIRGGFGRTSAAFELILFNSGLHIVPSCSTSIIESFVTSPLLNGPSSDGSDESTAMLPKPNAIISWGRRGRDFLRFIWRRF